MEYGISTWSILWTTPFEALMSSLTTFVVPSIWTV